MEPDLHPRWQRSHTHLQADIKRPTFKDCLELLVQIGELAEAQQHHPDLNLHDYNQLTITLTSHDADALTDKDYRLARAIDALLL